MIENGRLTRISVINNSPVKTDRGIGLGATVAAVREAYGDDLRSQAHKYEDPPAHYLTSLSQDGREEGENLQSARGIRFEMNGTGKVVLIHAGGPSIKYVEGCA